MLWNFSILIVFNNKSSLPLYNPYASRLPYLPSLVEHSILPNLTHEYVFMAQRIILMFVIAMLTFLTFPNASSSRGNITTFDNTNNKRCNRRPNNKSKRKKFLSLQFEKTLGQNDIFAFYDDVLLILFIYFCSLSGFIYFLILVVGRKSKKISL